MSANNPSNPPEMDLGETVRSLAAGQFVFNRFCLVRLIGRGRNSAVWQAWDDQGSRDVTLKFLPGRVTATPDAVAQIAGVVGELKNLSLPGLARVYDFVSEGPLAAVVGEWVEGTSLHELRQQRKNQVFDAVDLKEWLKQITKKLGELHAAGQAHGNLKPTNLLLTQGGDIVITDARLDAVLGYWVNKLEGSPRDIAQSFRYASPQQLGGETPTVSDDVYSLGVCLYELITSKPPFNTGNIVSQVKEDVPPTMTRRRRDMRIIGEPIPRAWDETVAACLTKEPAYRPENMEDLADRLELFGPCKRPPLPTPPEPFKAAPAAAPVATPVAAVTPPPEPVPVVSIPGAPAPAPAAPKKSLVPVIAVMVGVILGIVGWYISTRMQPAPTNVATHSPSPDSNTNAGLSAEELERRLAYEREALERKLKEERERLLEEQKKAEEELEQRRKALEMAAAQAKKAQEEAEARRRQAEEEARKREADALAKKRAAEEEAKRLEAERQAILKKEAELKRLAEEAAKKAGGDAIADAERRKIEEQLAAQRAEAERIKAAAEAALKEAEATRLAAEAAAKKLEEEERARKDMEAKAQAALEAERKRAEEEAKRKAELERKLVEAEKARLKAEEETRRKLEEAARRAEAERQARLAKLSEEARRVEEARRAEEARKAAEAKAKQEQQAAFQSQVSLVESRPVAGKIWHNSLGMRMVPLGTVFISAWETRVQDFTRFTMEKAVGKYDVGTAWKDPGFQQAPSHPVVNVSYEDALKFCDWLTQFERKAGIIGNDQLYRLPTDLEWSQAVGLPQESGATPAERSGQMAGMYPWGQEWPPPVGAGNYADYISFDRFENTAPVASFMPNAKGIFDLGGNAWEWVQDWGDAAQKQRVLRGGSYYGYIPGTLASSYRLLAAPNERRPDYGFRVVLSK